MHRNKPEPEPIDKKYFIKPSQFNTICNVIRRIYNTTDDEQIQTDCRIAMAMAKKMNQRLEAYKKGIA
jgi:hypothetical protein